MDIKKINKVIKDSNISLCSNCDGSGRVFDDSFGSGACDTVRCRVCNGHGRVKTVVAECEVIVPFNFKVD